MSRVRRLVLAGYLALLGASHVARLQQPEAAPAPDQRVQLVDGAPRLRSGAVRIAYRERLPPTASSGTSGASASAGVSSPAPVLLVHGSPGDGDAFRQVAPYLAATYRTLAPDLPGFGASSPRVPDYSIRAHAAMVLQLLDSLGIRQVHAVGFSLGGGVALEMHRADPGRLASLTLLSSIGVQEHELLGDYHLNHALHGLQLLAVVVATELLPHFGLLDGAFLGRSYARSFYDTDQRPLRGILASYPGPVLVVHGDRDPLVPVAAAREHHRIAPQSELVVLDGDHFATFQRPEAVAGPILDFVGRAEAGRAAVRASAAPERRRAAATPFDFSALPPAEGLALVATVLLLVAATFVSEDLTCIGAGLLIARGSLTWPAGIVACFAGILLGDLMLYAGGRVVGRPISGIAPVRWLVRPEDLDRACRWFEERSAVLILTGRFVPGTRLPTYAAAGVVRLPFPRFALWTAVAAALWTPALVGAVALFGTAAAEWSDVLQDRALPWLAATALIALIVLRVVLPLATRQGRQRTAARWERTRRWEFWPPWLFYLPVVACVAWLALRHRSLTVWAAANPGMPPDGGLVGESKFAILSAVDARRVARTRLLSSGAGDQGADLARLDQWVEELGGWPVVVKPDVGERGAGVSIVRDRSALAERVRRARAPLILQEYVRGAELGVFYYRIPGQANGRVFGITEKREPYVVGDGRNSIAGLVLAHKRLRCHFRAFARRLGAALDGVPAAGERAVLEERGNHCRGAEFRDGGRLETPALAAAIDETSRSVPGFYFGRYDVRGATLDDIRAGRFKVIELNGVSSEATHIYDPGNSLAAAYRTLFRQWELAFRIGAANRQRLRAQPPGPLLVLRRLRHHLRAGRRR